MVPVRIFQCGFPRADFLGSKKTIPWSKGFLPLLSISVIAREISHGLQLIDGHLRQELMGDAEVPFLVVEVKEGEADGALSRCPE